MYVSLNNKDIFCLYNLIKILSNFLISVLVSGWNYWMNLPKIVPSAFGPFIRPSSGVACMCKRVLFSKMRFAMFLIVFFIT